MEQTSTQPAPVSGAAAVVSATGEAPAVLVRAMVSLLSGVEPEGVSEAERVDAIGALEELKGAASAAQARLTSAAVSDREALGEDTRSVRAEVALARRCSPTVADRYVGVAKALTEEMPHTLAALTTGEISEWRATIMVRETACLTAEDRREVDARLATKLATLGNRALAGAARRIGAELDSESLALRHSRAVASRRVTVRPAPDGMAWLSILGPLQEIIGAQATLQAAEKQRYAVDPTLAGQDWEAAAAAARADQRSKGAWQADRALELLSGRATGQAQPVEVNLVMTDEVLLPGAFGGTVPADDTATIPGWGVIPGERARDLVRSNLEPPIDGDQADSHPSDCGASDHMSNQGPSDCHPSNPEPSDPESNNPEPSGPDRERDGAGVWLRRLFTTPDGRDLVAMDSKRRFFGGALRRFIELRDPTCRIPWCDAPAAQADHIEPAGSGGRTSAGNGGGLCQRHNLVKEHSGWRLRVTNTGLDGTGPHAVVISTPTGLTFDATAPPILGEGWGAGVMQREGPESVPAGVAFDQREFGKRAFREPDFGEPGFGKVLTRAECLDWPPEVGGPPPDLYPDGLPPLPPDPRAGSPELEDDWVPDETWFFDDPWAA